MSFTADLSKYAAQTKSDIGTAKRAIVFNVFGQVVKKTPVDTGRAKANWFVTDNQPSNQITDRDDNSPLGQTDGITDRVLNQVTGKLTLDILTNNLPYIERLEFGSSKQAPAGMVRSTLREFIRIAQREGWK